MDTKTTEGRIIEEQNIHTASKYHLAEYSLITKEKRTCTMKNYDRHYLNQIIKLNCPNLDKLISCTSSYDAL